MNTWYEVSRKNGICLGRNELPDALMMAVLDRTLTNPDEIAKGLFDAWTSAEFPSRMWARNEWIALFHRVGFLQDDTRANLPATLPLVLYRASPARYRDHLSWTDDLKQAIWFNDRNSDYFHLRERSRIWTIHPRSDALLAHFAGGRNENEWVLDIKKTDVSEYHPRTSAPSRPEGEKKSPDVQTIRALDKDQ